MPTHRFLDHFCQTSLAHASGVAMTPAFVPCLVFASMSITQQTAVQEIYRIAAERTREQLRPPRATAAFSRN